MVSEVAAVSNFRRTLRYLRHPMLVVLFLVAANVGVDVLAQPKQGSLFGNDLTTTELVILGLTCSILLVELVGAVISLVRKNLLKLLFHCLAITLLVCATVFAEPLLFARQYLNLWLFAGNYEDCARSAEPYGEGTTFALCSVQSFGSAYDVIVYDSGAQIALRQAVRSAAFRQFLKTRASPVLSECRTWPGKRLSAHFYNVQFDCDSDPDN
ncbi:hypothetical protein JQ615_29765 [Bradyrhizobium jicamae]|uniref:Uncharacterized protein n=1 Tax=Bradyrhizobium jicamae TaxID=280332 RepID=A0ABS5FRX1_9BRAD|nr:hypothetical protein [Bradyrhizobium jicamae]MBR0799567.1 hypothetical protein [Bradyrhizobium jicamae]